MTATEPTLPPLADFMRWMNEASDAFHPLLETDAVRAATVAAVVNDLLATLTGTELSQKDLMPLRPGHLNDSVKQFNRLSWILAACHMLWHPALRQVTTQTEELFRLLMRELPELADLLPIQSLWTDEERREELLRRGLRALDRRLPGEGEQLARERLTQVDSLERVRLLRDAAQREKRASDVREALRKKAAEEAAARYNHE